MQNPSDLLRRHLKSVIPYSSARDEYKGKEGIFLDANENSMGSTVAGGPWNRYPDPHQLDLKRAISNSKNISQDRIFLGNGSDEVIDLLIRAFCEPGIDDVLIFPPTYGMYEVCASISKVGVRKVQLTTEFQLDMPSIRLELTASDKLIFICSPNNPTGNNLRRLDIEEIILKAPGLVVIDEAYVDFSAEESAVSWLSQYPNVVVLQTFSKAWGMASLRLGMAFGHPSLIQILNKIKPPYNIPGPTQQMAIKALTKEQQKNEWVELLQDERDSLTSRLAEMRIVDKVFRSDANFLLVRFRDANDIFDYLIKQNIIVRNRSKQPLCDNCLRITIGTPEENNLVVQALKSYRST